jgi:hypothetical protein
VAFIIPSDGSSDSHRVDRDLKAPLPVADNIVPVMVEMRKNRAEIPSNDVNAGVPPPVVAEVSKRLQTKEPERGVPPAPWLQTRGPRPVDALQQQEMSPVDQPRDQYQGKERL